MHSFESSTSFVRTLNSNLDVQTYYHSFCDGFTQEQTEMKLSRDIENSVFEAVADSNIVEDSHFLNWRKEQIENGFPILKSSETESFWRSLMKRQQSNLEERVYLTRSNNILVKKFEKEKKAEDVERVKLSDCCVVEKDTIIMLNNRSIASILKSKGKYLFTKYNQLSLDQQALCAYNLCGILDFTNELVTGQRGMFTPEQWEYLKHEFDLKREKHLPHLGHQLLEVLKSIKKMIKNGDGRKAYYYTLKMVEKSSPRDEWVLKVLYHVLNVYLTRTQVFTSNALTETDYMAKLWNEFFENMFGTDAQYLKWGESVSNSTTETKKKNNQNLKHTIGCKVDGRILCRVESTAEVLDLCNIEAAKSTKVFSKNMTDNAKLAIETKCVLDDLISRSNFNMNTNPRIQNVQICGYQAIVSSMQLLDHGFYIQRKDFSISLEVDLLTFGENLTHWIRKLTAFKTHCNNIQIMYSTAANTTRNDHIDTAFGHEITSKPVNQTNKNWVRGTFIMPAFGKEPFFPKNFLSSNNVDNLNEQTTETENIILNDGTLIKRRLWKEKELKKLMKSQKRKHHDSNSSEVPKKNRK